MVKNNFGGNKAKRGARKNADGGGVSRELRLIEEDGECYAIITKIQGGGMCNAACYDGKERLCVIPGKFKGRGRSSNRIEAGSWVMVGIRDWEVRSDGNQKCDLLHIYSDGEKDKLISRSDINFTYLISAMKTMGKDTNANTLAIIDDASDGVIFGDSKADKYQELISSSKTSSANVVLVSSGQINIDDI
jgi:initiation factor 1A